MADILYLQADNDFDVSLDLGTTGLTVTCLVSATKTQTAVAIDAALTPTITEVGTSGVYAGVIQGSAITSKLCTPIAPATTDYKNKLVYLIWKVGTDFHAFRTCIVRDYRQAS